GNHKMEDKKNVGVEMVESGLSNEGLVVVPYGIRFSDVMRNGNNK
ncbi:hypothetical protein A2U01_0015461, partial [Trifolium medium]|nr:hypothetical protein [Trifolium medium]